MAGNRSPRLVNSRYQRPRPAIVDEGTSLGTTAAAGSRRRGRGHSRRRLSPGLSRSEVAEDQVAGTGMGTGTDSSGDLTDEGAQHTHEEGQHTDEGTRQTDEGSATSCPYL
jgi:hypothetical protein